MTRVDNAATFAYDSTARHHLITPKGSDPRRGIDPTMTLSPNGEDKEAETTDTRSPGQRPRHA